MWLLKDGRSYNKCNMCCMNECAGFCTDICLACNHDCENCGHAVRHNEEELITMLDNNKEIKEENEFYKLKENYNKEI